MSPKQGNANLKSIIAAMGGASVGFGWYWFVGCTADCGVWSNPYLSTIAGAVLGWAVFGGTVRDFEATGSQSKAT